MTFPKSIEVVVMGEARELPAVLVHSFWPGAGLGRGRAPQSVPACSPSCLGVLPCPQTPWAECRVQLHAQACPH